MQKITDEGKKQVMLDGDWTVANAAGLKDLLLEALAASDHIELNLQGVTGMDLTALQLICSAHRTARASGKDLSLSGTENEVLLQARKKAGYIRHQGCTYNPTKSCLWVGGTE